MREVVVRKVAVSFDVSTSATWYRVYSSPRADQPKRLEVSSMPQHIDDNGNVTWTYVCYVIELDPDACTKRNSPCGGTECGRTAVYVGQTATTPKERFDQHKRGYRASRVVNKHGLWVRSQLARGFGELPTQEAALAAEAVLGERLRSRGYCVYGAH
jgi:hypothetical protein